MTQQSEIDKLMQFYGVRDMEALCLLQARQIERLQAKLIKLSPDQPVRLNPPREG